MGRVFGGVVGAVRVRPAVRATVGLPVGVRVSIRVGESGEWVSAGCPHVGGHSGDGCFSFRWA